MAGSVLFAIMFLLAAMAFHPAAAWFGGDSSARKLAADAGHGGGGDAGHAAAVADSAAAPAAAGGDHEEEAPVTHGEPPYGYHWHGKDWGGACTDPSSRFQSPINIDTAQAVAVPGLGDLRRRANYPLVPTNITLSHDNHTVKVAFPKGNRLRLPMFRVPTYTFNTSWDPLTYTPPLGQKPRAITFHLTQCHMHTMAEHLIDGKQYDLTMHCVHAQKGGVNNTRNPSFGVFAVFFNRTADNICNKFLMRVLAAFPELITHQPYDGFDVEFPDFSLKDVFPEDGSYYHYYPGSLTVPTCTEGLLWYVFKKPMSMCELQLRQFQDLVFKLHGEVAGNYREVQPLNNRTVYYWEDPKPGRRF